MKYEAIIFDLDSGNQGRLETLREAKESDLPGIIELYKQLNPDDNYDEIEKINLLWKDILSNSNLHYFIAEINGIIVSTCNLTIIPNITRSARPFSVIENVITHKDYRNKGYGKNVINKAIDFAKHNNCYKIMLLSNVKRKEAHKFYENLGFNSKDKIGFFIYL
jgi:GNAT superfamily N-acetyltransferase